jgi:putative restriction endonuclease
MDEADSDALLRMAAFEQVRRLTEAHDHLTVSELQPGFFFDGKRIPLINPRGIFKPRQMQYLLSIKTVYPRPGARIWYDDQKNVHRQIFESEETVEYAFMGQNPEAADNRWLRDAFENQIPVIYFLGIAPGCYQAMLPVFIVGWDRKALKAQIAFGVPDQQELIVPENALERRYALRAVQQRLHQDHSVKRSSQHTTGAVRYQGYPNSDYLMRPISYPIGTNISASRLFPMACHCLRFITLHSMLI